MRRVAVLVVVSACGLDLQGPTPVASDAGRPSSTSSSSSSSTSSTGGASTTNASAPFCSTVRATKCLDFDAPAASPFGFDLLSQSGDWWKASVAGGAFAIDVSDTRQGQNDHGGHGTVHLVDYPAKTTMTLELDFVVDTIAMEYAVIAGFVIRGEDCAATLGLAVDATNNLKLVGGARPTDVGTFEPKRRHHLLLESSAPPNARGVTTLTVDGRALGDVPVTFAPSCDVADAYVGAFYTSQRTSETIGLRYDNVVVRIR
ncbi:MAG: hypothetical protein KIT84_26205 [Labilithrix sp.]|nr:hypothetical protein [Labilithrix sp.]MCW5814549.1 hypothetical protein [Labilithrix sp.]